MLLNLMLNLMVSEAPVRESTSRLFKFDYLNRRLSRKIRRLDVNRFRTIRLKVIVNPHSSLRVKVSNSLPTLSKIRFFKLDFINSNVRRL